MVIPGTVNPEAVLRIRNRIRNFCFGSETLSGGERESRRSSQTSRRTYCKKTEHRLKEDPPRGLGKGSVWPQSFPDCSPLDYLLCGVSESLTKNGDPDHEDEADDGVPRQGHHGQGLQDVPVQD